MSVRDENPFAGVVAGFRYVDKRTRKVYTLERLNMDDCAHDVMRFRDVETGKVMQLPSEAACILMNKAA